VRQVFLRTILCAAVAAAPALADGRGDVDVRTGNYTQTNLVSDQTGVATHTDPDLVNAWGMALLGGGPWWVNANGTGLSLVYDSTGAPYPSGSPLIVAVPPFPSAPTGIVSNGTQDFQVAPGLPALFLFDTEDGTISGWNSSANATDAILKVTTPDAVYKALAMGQMNGANVLYAANFHSGWIEVYDSNFNPVTLPSGAFVDPAVPAGYGPFNIQNIGGNIFVTWAEQDADKHDEVDGPGLGYVDEFSPSGTLILQFQHGNYMNAPWGLAMAPARFGPLSGDLLVGNFGSGQIAAFNASTGAFVGTMNASRKHPVTIDGLWGMQFGNGGLGGSSSVLYFTAGPQGESHGLFGSLAFTRK